MRFAVAMLVFFCTPCMYGQELSFKHFTGKDGLPGSVIYQTLQDRSGFIWFATNQGVSRFNGKTFTNYTREDGLPDNEIISLYLDKYNNVWFISFVGIPSVFIKGSIKRFDNCKQVIGICEDRQTDSIILLSQFTFQKDSIITTYSSLDRDGEWAFSSNLKKSPPNQIPYNLQLLNASSEIGANFYFSMIAEGYSLYIKDRILTKQYIFKTNKPSLFPFPFTNNHFLNITKQQNGIVFFSFDSLYFANFRELKGIASLKQLKSNFFSISSLFIENDSTLWICSKTAGLMCIKNFLTSHSTVHRFFTGSFCTSIIKDEENGYWVTTYNDGVYFLPNLNFYTLSIPNSSTNQNALCIRSINTREIAAGFANGNVIIVNHASQTWQKLPSWTTKDKNQHILDLAPLGADRLFVGTEHLIYLIFHHKEKALFPDGVKGMYVSGRNIFVGTYMNVVKLDCNGNITKTIFNKRTTCITGLGKTIYWGTLEGVYSYSNGNVELMAKKQPSLSGFIYHIDIAKDSSVWVSTPHGIIVFKNGIVVSITKKEGLCSNTCKQVAFDKNTGWIATDKGISRVDYHWKNNNLIYSISNITQEDGLISDNINQTTVVGNYIWAATSGGVCWFSKNYISHPVLPPIINIDRIVRANNTMPVSDTIQINNQKSKLLIELSGISFRSGRQIHYEYRLTGVDTNWGKTSNSIIEFPGLPFGKFIFEAKAVDRWGLKSKHSKKIVIINSPPWWKTTWFYACTYLLLTGILCTGFSLYFRNRIKKREQEHLLKKKVYDLEMVAFRSQMNPHFIFNCLTSIQYFIMRSDVKKANAYLCKFSTLIRQTLQHSTDSIILLREEIKLLNLYLELEKLRLNDRMEFQFMVCDNLDLSNIYIPTMIIQPFVENAIKHGIAPLQDRQGKITIEVKKSINYIEVIIEDNGPGVLSLRKASEFDKDYRSMGTDITVSRINAINAIQKNTILHRVTDKCHHTPQGQGTIVYLSFPITSY